MAEPRSYENPGWTANLLRHASVQPGDRVVVVVDEPLVEEGSQLAAAVRDAGAEGRLELWAGKRPLTYPPPKVLLAAREADVGLFLMQAPRPDEAEARFKTGDAILNHGGRALFLGFVNAELLTGELSQPAADLEEPARRLLAELEGSRELHLRGREGTDLTLRVDGRPWLTDVSPLRGGDFGNYPGGEIYIAPHRDGADGILVADLTVPYTIDGLVDEPVRLTFEAGRVTSIEGGEAARILREIVTEAGPGGDVIAELGLGLNPRVRPRGHVMLDEKAARTAHVAIGRNTGSYGGDNEASIHVDCVFSEPEISADGRRVPLP